MSQVAIDCFFQQTYPDRQLVIVNHSGEPFQLHDPRVKELLVERPPTLGELRNIGLEAADGDLVITWDDDDWHSPMRMEVQVAAWKATKRPNVLSCYVTCDVRTGDAFVRSCRNFECRGCCGLILFPRTGCRYPALNTGEDTALAKIFLKAGDLTVLDDNPMLYFRTCHGANTWPHEFIMTNPRRRGGELTTAQRAWVKQILELYVKAGALPSNPAR
jgi:glycosyltransferase involved in cell wall biosynthesis